MRVDDADRYGRGGLLPMSVFLTKNAPGLRTSPVKRGYWVVEAAARRTIPPPPAVVPELPRDEAKLELPLREMLARHREDPSLRRLPRAFRFLRPGVRRLRPGRRAAHEGPGGRPVDASATFPGGGAGSGLSKACATYVRANRQDDFVDNLCRKLLAYALGRSLMLSDEPADRGDARQARPRRLSLQHPGREHRHSPQFLTSEVSRSSSPRGEEHEHSSERRAISRRTVLRGVGVTMALPWLESLPALAAAPPMTRRHSRNASPSLFMGNGINGNHWWAKGAGAEMKLGKTLAPLEPLKKKINVINGLFNQPAVGMGIHPGQTGNLLSGVPIQKGAIVKAGITHGPGARRATRPGDAAAQHGAGLRAAHDRLPRDELLDGLQLAHLLAQRRTRRCPTRSIRRWPSTACSRTAAACATRASWTACKDRAASLSREVSSTDRAKLDEYLTSVREVEKRVERMRGDKDKADDQRQDPGQARAHDGAPGRTACPKTCASTRG